MAQACPINFTQVDNTVSRIVSLFTAGVVTLFLVTDSAVVLYLLGADLMLRLYGAKPFSPLYNTAVAVKKAAGLPTRITDGAAKTVAGHFGLLFIVLLSVFAYMGLTYTTYAVAAVYIFCLLLDLFVGFCVGCKVYQLYRVVVKVEA